MILILSGLACLVLGGSIFYSILTQQAVQPTTVWTRTELRSTATALTLIFLGVFGLGLLVKGVLS